jgi:hypothetical protein
MEINMSVEVQALNSWLDTEPDLVLRLLRAGWNVERAGDPLILWHHAVSSVQEAEEWLRSAGLDPRDVSIENFEGSDEDADDEAAPTVVTNLSRAFEEMRRRGLLAEENYHYSSSSGLAPMAEEAARRVRRGVEVLGYVYYEDLYARYFNLGEHLSLAYGQLEHDDLGKIGMVARQVGKVVCECLDMHGVAYEWDGYPGRPIQVKAKSVVRVS